MKLRSKIDTKMLLSVVCLIFLTLFLFVKPAEGKLKHEDVGTAQEMTAADSLEYRLAYVDSVQVQEWVAVKNTGRLTPEAWAKKHILKPSKYEIDSIPKVCRLGDVIFVDYDIFVRKNGQDKYWIHTSKKGNSDTKMRLKQKEKVWKPTYGKKHE